MAVVALRRTTLWLALAAVGWYMGLRILGQVLAADSPLRQWPEPFWDLQVRTSQSLYVWTALLAILGWSFYSWMLARPPASMRGKARPVSEETMAPSSSLRARASRLIALSPCARPSVALAIFLTSPRRMAVRAQARAPAMALASTL